jgi:hypothetical protein
MPKGLADTQLQETPGAELTCASAASFIPRELIQCFVDELRDDRVFLRACSLVATPWLFATRCHLFSEATIGLSQLKALCNLQSASTCTIIGAIKRLTLYIRKDPPLDEENPEELLEQWIAYLLQLDLTGVHSLGFRLSSCKIGALYALCMRKY